jgi:hypothetical protein
VSINATSGEINAPLVLLILSHTECVETLPVVAARTTFGPAAELLRVDLLNLIAYYAWVTGRD